MAAKFLVLDEAARMLGVSPDQLNEMRQRQEISAYRDGASWKFKASDVERLARDRANRGSQAGDDLGDDGYSISGIDDDLSLDLDDEIKVAPGPSSSASANREQVGPGEEADLSLSDDFELAQPGPAVDRGAVDDLNLADKQAASTGESNDLQLGSDDDFDLKLADNDLQLGDEDDLKIGSSQDLTLSGDDDLNLAEPAATGARPADQGDFDLAMDDGDSFELAPSGAGTAEKKPAEAGDSLDFDQTAATKAGGSDIALSDDLALSDDDVLALMDESGPPAPSAAKPAAKQDEDLAIGDDDVLLSSGDSGIELLAESEGDELKLDDELKLEDDDVKLDDLAQDELLLSEEGPPSSGALGSDEDFQLTPFEDIEGDASESGSQVIALDATDEFTEVGGGLEAAEEPAMAGMLEEEESPASSSGISTLAAAGMQPATSTSAVAAEAPYSTLDVVLLVLGALLLLLTGLMMFDMLRNLGGWDGPMSVNKTLMDTLLDTLGW